MIDGQGNFRWKVLYHHKFGPKETGGWMVETLWAKSMDEALQIFWDVMRGGQRDSDWARNRKFISGVEVRPA